MEICQKSPSSDSIIEFMGDGSWRPTAEASGIHRPCQNSGEHKSNFSHGLPPAIACMSTSAIG